MTEDRNADETAGEQFESITRRRMMKAIGVGGAAATVPSVATAKSSGANHAKGSDHDVGVVGSKVKAKSEAAEDARAVRQLDETDEVKQLASSISDEAGFDLNYEEFVSLELQTTNEKLDELNPAVLHLPIKPRAGSYTMDNGGVLMVMTAEKDGERVPIASLGTTREKTSREMSVQSSEQAITMKAFGATDTGTGVVETTMDSSATEVETNALPDVTCGACEVILGTACLANGGLSYSACASAAISTGAINPFAGGLVAAFCTYVVSSVAVTCLAGPFSICVAAGFCDVVN